MGTIANQEPQEQSSSASSSNERAAHTRPVMALLVIVSLCVSFVTLTLPLVGISFALATTMAVIAAIDIAEFRIPDILSLPATVLGLVASGNLVFAQSQHLVEPSHAAATVIGALSLLAVRAFYHFVRRREGLGLGDVKLFACAGAWIGIEHLADCLLIACGLALGAILTHWLRTGADRLAADTPIPFGAALAPAIWIVWYMTVWVKF